jgi:tetratricopeptide (TPR) repeat protein
MTDVASDEAAKKLERTLAANSANPVVINQLATSYWRSGKLDLAAQCLGHLIELNPGNANAWNNQGICLEALGETRRASESFQKALELEPNNYAFLVNFGKSLTKERSWKKVVQVFYLALELQPLSLDCLGGLAEGLHATGEYAERDLICQRLSKLEGLSLGDQITRASVFNSLEHSARALELVEIVLRSAPDSSDALLLKGEILTLLGRHEEAVPALENAIRAQPQFLPTYFFLAQAKKFQEKDIALIEQMEQLVSATPGQPYELAMLHYALGSAYNGLKSYGKAIHHFDESNKISKSTVSLYFDREEFKELSEGVLHALPKKEIEKLDAVAGLSQRPVFIVGMPRSGTTLTESIVGAHPQVAVAGELMFWQIHAPVAVTSRPNVVQTQKALSIGRNYLDLIENIDPDAMRVVDKNPFNFLHAGLIAKVLPNARFIHCVRHPVDVCLSFWMSSFKDPPPFSFDRANLVFYYQQYERMVSHWREALGPERWLDIRYEQLVANQEAESRRLIEFIGLEWDDFCLQPEKVDRVVSTASHWQARQPVYKTSVERWRNYEPWLREFRDLLQEPPVY